MKQWKKLLKLIAVTACVGMLVGCGERAESPIVPSATPQETVTAMPTAISTPVPTAASTPVPTATSTPVPTATSTPVPTVTSTPVPTATSTPVPTAASTPVPTATSTPVPTATSTPAPTAASTPVPTATSTPVPTAIPTPTVAPTKAPATTADTLTGLTAFEITSQMIVGWNLGNVLDSTGSNITYDSAPAKAAMAWGNKEPAKEQFEAVKAAGFNTVRIPTTWYQHVKYDGSNYIISPDWMDYVKQTVDYAYDLDMFVILNVHHEEWVNVGQFTDSTYNTASKMLADIWSQIAETFKAYDQHLIFEGMNEPRQTGLGGEIEWGGGDASSWKYINDLNAVFVSTVRGQGSAANKERLLMLPGYGASSSTATVKAIELPENSGNVALSVHAYLPYFFAMATDSYANHSFPGKSGYGENYETSITDFFKDLKKISDSKNVPIIIGEFGASDFNNTEDRARWATHYLTCAKAAGIPCVLWDNHATYNGSGEAHGYLYQPTCTWFESSIPVLEAMMAVYGQESVLPVYKAYVKPAFAWNNIGMTNSWVQIFRSDAGQKVDDWGNIWLDNWKDYVTEQYDIVLVYDSEAEPYMVLQGGWYKVYAENPGNTAYTIWFTYEDVQKTMQMENVKLEDMTGFFASANGKPMTVYGVFAVPVK